MSFVGALPSTLMNSMCLPNSDTDGDTCIDNMLPNDTTIRVIVVVAPPTLNDAGEITPTPPLAPTPR